MRQAEKERKKILFSNSIHTQPEQENSEKNSKKIHKIKKPISDIILSQNGLRWAEKARKKFQSRIPFILVSGKKIPKKIAKNFKKLKNLFPVLFLAKTGLDRPRKRKKKKIQSRIPFIRDTGKKIPKKIAKKFKKFKNLFPALFLAETGLEIGRASCRERV